MSAFGGGEGVVGGSGGDLLSHVLRRSTMGAAGFHGRVRNGVGWGTRAIGHQIDPAPQLHPTRSSPARGPRSVAVHGTAAEEGWLGKSWHGSRCGFVVVADGGGGHSGD